MPDKNYQKFIAKVADIGKLRILAHDIELKLMEEERQPENAGLCQLFKFQSILVREDQHPQQLLCTIIHEVIHTIEKMHQHEFTEQQIDAIALGMFSLLAENPKFRKLFDLPGVGK